MCCATLVTGGLGRTARGSRCGGAVEVAKSDVGRIARGDQGWALRVRGMGERPEKLSIGFLLSAPEEEAEGLSRPEVAAQAEAEPERGEEEQRHTEPFNPRGIAGSGSGSEGGAEGGATHTAVRNPASRGRSFECPQCDKRFSNMAKLLYHSISHGREGRKLYVCDECEIAFPKQCSLNNHIRCVHEWERDHQCEECPKSFFCKKDLVKHVVSVHEGLRPHPCPTCGKGFSKPEHVKRHLRTVHNVERSKPPKPGSAKAPSGASNPTPEDNCPPR